MAVISSKMRKIIKICKTHFLNNNFDNESLSHKFYKNRKEKNLTKKAKKKINGIYF